MHLYGQLIVNKGSGKVNMREIRCIDGPSLVNISISPLSKSSGVYLFERFGWGIHCTKGFLGSYSLLFVMFFFCCLFCVALTAFNFGFIFGMVNLFCCEKSLILGDA